MALVAPFAGAWIEISKYVIGYFSRHVAPFAGAWIEIMMLLSLCKNPLVAPFAGAWIEISKMIFPILGKASLPSRERGLKSRQQ